MKKEKYLLFLYNPVSGNRRIIQHLSSLINGIVQAGWKCEVYPTQGPQDAFAKIAREGSDYERIIVAGGDGILHESVNGLLDGSHTVPFGYIPAGTVNDFAGTHEIPADCAQALELALSDHFAQVDLGSFNGEYFTYVAAFGPAAAASYETSQDMKNRFGYLAYFVQALKLIDFSHWENNCSFMKVKLEDRRFEGDFIMGIVSNARLVAGTEKLISAEPSLNDGLLEVLFIRRPMNLMDLDAILRGIRNADYSGRLFETGQSSFVHIEGDSTGWSLDGEFGGDFTRADIQVCPSRLTICSSLVKSAETEERKKI